MSAPTVAGNLIDLSGLTFAENTVRTITVAELNITDFNAGEVDTSFAIVSQPTKGSLVVVYDQGVNDANAFEFTPTANTNGADQFTMTATNSNGPSDTITVTFNIDATNNTLTFTSTAVTAVDEDAVYTYNVTTTDLNGVALTITSVNALPGWLTLTPTNGVDASAVLTGTPVNDDVGTHAIVLQVGDGVTTTDQSFNIVVSNTNDAPVFSPDSASVNAIEDIAFTYSSIPAATDVDSGDSDTITYSLESQTHDWMLFDTNTRVITGTPLAAHVGANTAVIRATDSNGGIDDFTLTVTVAVQQAPTANGNGATIIVSEDDADSTVDLSPHFADPDGGDNLTFSSSVTATSVANLVTTSHSGSNMVVAFGANLNGTATIQVTATDQGANSVTKDFSVTVTSVNDAPASAGGFTNISGLSDTLNLTPTTVDLSGRFTDVEGDNLTFTVASNDTALATVSAVTGTTFTVSSAGTDVSGSTTLNVTANDGTDTTTVTNAINVDISSITAHIANTADITTLAMSFFDTAQRMQAITSAQIPALSSTQIANMTSAQAAQLTTTQVTAFTANVTPMHYSVYDSLTHAASSNEFLTGGAINFNANSLRSQQPSTIKQFNKATLEALTPELFKVLNVSQIDAFQSEQMPYIDTTLLQVLDKVDASGSIVHFSTATTDRHRDAIQELAGTQLSNLDSTQIGLLSAASRLQWFSPAKLAVIDSATFGSINPVQFDTFDAAQFAAFDVSALSNMVQAQFDKLATSTNNLFANLNASQLQAIPASLFAGGAVLAAHVSRLDTKIPNLTSAQIGNVAPAVGALTSLTTADIGNLSDAAVGALLSSFVVELSDAQRNDGFTSAQIPFISVTAINALSDTQIAALDANFTASLDVSQVSGITGQAKIQSINVQHLDSIETELTNAQLAELSTTQIANITHPAQIAALSTASKLQHLTTTQIPAIIADQFDDIADAQFDTFTSAQMAAFSDSALGNMTDSQFDKLALTTENLFSSLDASAINAIPDARFLRTVAGHMTKLGSSLSLLSSDEFRNIPSSVVNSNITVAQLQAIPTTTVDDFNASDISNMDISLVNLLTPTQIQTIPTNAFSGFQTSKITAFDVSFIGSLLQAQVISFAVDNTPSQLQSLAVKDLSNILDLSDNQISNLLPAQVTSLSTGDIAALSANNKISGFLQTSNQIGGITVTQIPHVTDAEIDALSDAQVAGLTTATIQALDISQVEALKEQVADLTPDASSNFPLAVSQIPFLHTSLVLPNLTAAQLQSFTGPQVTALSRPQLHVIRDTGSLTLNGFLASQITNLTVADHFEDANGVLGIINDVALFDQTRFGGFNLSQLVNLLDNHTGKFVALSTAQKNGVTAAFQALAYNDVQSVGVDKLAYLTADQLLSVTSAQVVGNNSALSLAQSGSMAKNLRTKTATDLSNLDVVTTKQFYITNYTNTAISDPFIKAFRDLNDTQIGGFTSAIMDIVNDPSNITQFTSSELDKFSAEAFSDLSINLISDATFNGLNDTTYGEISRTQGSLLDASNIQNLDVSFALLSPSMVDTLVLGVIPFINASSITEAQANAFTTDQAAAFTSAQTSLFTAAVLTILSDTAGFDFTTTPLEFKLSQLNTNVDVQSMQITITPSDVSASFNYDATVQSYMTLADAKKMFLYRYSNESEVRLYVDKRNFNINFDYLECNHLDLSDGDPVIGKHNMKFTDTAVDNSSVTYFTNSANTVGNLGFIGNVSVNPITEDTRMPFTWDYIHYTAREVLGVFSAYPLFNNIRTVEETMRKNINDSIRQVIVPIINNIDISSGLTDVSGAGSDTNLDIVTNSNLNGSDGDPATPYDQDLIDGVTTARHIVFDNSFSSSEEISSTIFRTLMIQRKPDFNQTEEQEIAYGFPFRAGDSMSFIVTMNPHAEQKKVAGVSGTSVGEKINGRKYRINIQFTA